MTFAKQNLSEIDTAKPLTIICHPDDIEVVNDRDDILEITPESTLTMAARFKPSTWAMAKQDEDFKSRLAIVFPDWDIVKDDKNNLSEYPVAYRHVVGLIVCTNMAINTGHVPFWRTPETYLHPRTQSRLADLAVRYSKDTEAAYKSISPSAGHAYTADTTTNETTNEPNVG